VVEARDHAFVAEVLTLSDQCCDRMLDTEYRTITRRILARVAARDPRPLRRSTRADRCGAGLVWLAGRANGEFGRRGRWTNQRLWDWFGVGDCSPRGYTLRNAAGLGPEVVVAPRWSYGSLSLGDPALLHSRFRSSLLAQRDALLAIAARRRTWSLAHAALPARGRATPVTAVAAVKGVAEEGSRAFVVIGFGDELEDLDDLDDTTFFALTIPDAHELVRMVQRALADPLPRHEAS
jgi:hypothetical protein